MKEEAVLFGTNRSFVGILARPSGTPNQQFPAVLLLNAGLVHRMGPNRIYVKLARKLAEMGFYVLRFDMSGIGDSKARQDNLPFEKSAVDDVQQAMDYLTKTLGMKSFLLMGHCAGAINSFRTATQDDRVMGAVLMNPEGGDQEWVEYDQKRKLANYYQNYYSSATLTSRDRWIKLLTGKASYRSILRNVFQNIIWNKISTQFFQVKNKLANSRDEAADPVTQQTIAALKTIAKRDIRLLMIYPEGSTGYVRVQLTLKGELEPLISTGKVKLTVIPQCDHTYTLISMQEALFAVIQNWTQSLVKESGMLAAT